MAHATVISVAEWEAASMLVVESASGHVRWRLSSSAVSQANYVVSTLTEDAY